MGPEMIKAEGMWGSTSGSPTSFIPFHLLKDPRHFHYRVNPKLRKAPQPKVTEAVLETQGHKNPGFLTPVLELFPLGYSRQKFKFVMIYEASGT